MPSSESLIRGTLYALISDLLNVLYTHSHEIWQNTCALEIPATREDLPYGIPEMAVEVRQLLRDAPVMERCTFAMGGHEVAIVFFSQNLDEAGNVMMTYQARAFALKTGEK